MELHLKIIGILMIILSIVHIGFPRYFDWKNDLKNLSLINRQMMQVHTFFIAFVVLLIGILCISSSDDLVNTEFGRRISLGIGLFWGVRLLIQFFGYSFKLWKNKPFETVMHIVFSILWFYMTVVFVVIYFL